MLSAFSSLDVYFMELDKGFCTGDCPCKINEFTEFMYKADPIDKIEFEMGNTVTGEKFTKISDCRIFDEISDKYHSRDTGYIAGARDYQFSRTKFKKYWKNLEKKFDCTGFCSNAYYDHGTKTYKKLNKFLFSGINRGVPKHSGCWYELIKYVSKMLISFGSFALFTGVIEILITIVLFKIIQMNTKLRDIKMTEEEEPIKVEK